MNGMGRKAVIQPELDIKNKVLKDKRKALIKVLKDKRPNVVKTEIRSMSKNYDLDGETPSVFFPGSSKLLVEKAIDKGSKLFPKLGGATSLADLRS